jgi:hypothetical protein
MNSRSQCLLILLLLSISYLHSQSGWTQAKGDLFSKVDIAHFSSSAYYNPDGIKLNTNSFRQTSINGYFESGLTSRITLIASMPLLRIQSFDGTKPVSANGDLQLGIKYRVTKNNQLPITISVMPDIPIGQSTLYSNHKSIPGEKINLPTGDGEFNVITTLAASHSYKRWYGSIYGSYNMRSQYKGLSFRDQYIAGAEIGVALNKKLWVNTKLRSVWSTGPSLHPELGFLRGDGISYTAVSGEVFYKWKQHWGVSAQVFGPIALITSLKNLYVAAIPSIGVIYEIKK